MQHYEDDRLSEALFGDGTRLYIDTEDLGGGTTAARLAKYDETGEISSVTSDFKVPRDFEESLTNLLTLFIQVEAVKRNYENSDFAEYLHAAIIWSENCAADFIREKEREYKEMLRVSEKIREMFPGDVIDTLVNATVYFKNATTNDLIEAIEKNVVRDNEPEI